MIAKILTDEPVKAYLHRMIDEAFFEEIEDVNVELTDELGIYRDYGEDARNEFMTAYPYRKLVITVNFLDKPVKDEKAIK